MIRALMVSLMMTVILACTSAKVRADLPTIEISDNQSISNHVQWLNNNYTIHGDVTVEPGGVLEIGSTGPGVTAVIEGKLVINEGGRVIIGHKPSGEQSVCDVHGNIELSGSLTVDNAIVEIVGTYQNEFLYNFHNGTLTTRNGSIIGGAEYDGKVYATGFDLSSGRWNCSDTTIRDLSGVWVSGSGVFNGQRVEPGEVPDAIHALEGATVVLKDSTYDILFTIDFTKGRTRPVVLNLPANVAIPYWDNSKLPGAKYTLKLFNHKASLWWLNVIVASKGQAPDALLVLDNTPSLGMHLVGTNLRNAHRYDFQLPVSWSGDPDQAEVRGEAPWIGDVPVGCEWYTGNLRWKVGRKPANISCWGVYPSGPDTRLVLTGPTKIAELIFSEGTVYIRGTPGRHDASATGQFFEVGTKEGEASNRANLVIENALIGIFDPNSRSWGGYFRAWNEGHIFMQNSRIGIATMATSGSGHIEGGNNVCAVRLKPPPPPSQPDYQESQEGGPIRVPHNYCP